MKTTWTFSPDEIAPAPETVYGLQGIPEETPVPQRVSALFAKGVDFFRATAEPRGIVASIGHDEFEIVYQGEGKNELYTPVSDIAPQAERLALFAVTLGPRIGAEIEDCFGANDLALATMLDAVASAAADKAADTLQGHYERSLALHNEPERRLAVLRYSPGYCGWHVSGQRKLFDYLCPERIGLGLRPSFLMEPLKSVSGVFIAGQREIHVFPDEYDFCGECDTHSCRERIESLDEDAS